MEWWQLTVSIVIWALGMAALDVGLSKLARAGLSDVVTAVMILVTAIALVTYWLVT